MMDSTRLSITCHHIFANASGANILSHTSNKTYYCSTGRNMTVLAGVKQALLPCMTVKNSSSMCCGL